MGTVKKMKAKVIQKYLSKRTEAYSSDLESSINEGVRNAVEGEVKKVTDNPPLGASSLLTAGQEITATATSQPVTWNSGKELKKSTRCLPLRLLTRSWSSSPETSAPAWETIGVQSSSMWSSDRVFP